MRKTVSKPMKRGILFCTLVMLFIGLSTTNVVAAPPVTKLYVDPHISIAAVYQTFNVSIKVDDVTNLYGFQFYLYYNTTVLDAVRAEEGPFLKSVPQDPPAQTFGWLNITDEDGLIRTFISLLGTQVTEPSGSGILATITFNVTASGSSALDLLDKNEATARGLSGYETKLGDRNANPITHTTVDGFFGKPVSITVSPTTVAVDSNVTISGGIHPIAENEDVYIEYKREGEATWNPLATVKTDANGAYSYTWKTTEGGTFKLRAKWLTNISDEVTVTVEAPSFITMYIAVAVIAVVVVVAAVYFLKLRKPK